MTVILLSGVQGNSISSTTHFKDLKLRAVPFDILTRVNYDQLAKQLCL